MDGQQIPVCVASATWQLAYGRSWTTFDPSRSILQMLLSLPSPGTSEWFGAIWTHMTSPSDIAATIEQALVAFASFGLALVILDIQLRADRAARRQERRATMGLSLAADLRAIAELLPANAALGAELRRTRRSPLALEMERLRAHPLLPREHRIRDCFSEADAAWQVSRRSLPDVSGLDDKHVGKALRAMLRPSLNAILDCARKIEAWEGAEKLPFPTDRREDPLPPAELRPEWNERARHRFVESAFRSAGRQTPINHVP